MVENKPKFEVIVLGIIFDPKKKKILIGRRENDPYIKNLDWCFPGGRLNMGEDVDQSLKKKMKLKTGYTIKNLGTIFSDTRPERPSLVELYFLTEVFEGKEKPGNDIVELRWISPKEIDQYFKISMHRKLKEFLNDLV
jgi:ADP-ribose pyrophosphatase YjhB (NUDIX family)